MLKSITNIFVPALCAILLCAGIVVAQNVSEADAKRAAEMKRLEPLYGTWKGSGWVLTRDGRQESTITETLRPRLGGRIAVVEGLGTTPDAKTGTERVTHQAFAIFSYDEKMGRIRLRYFKAENGAEGVSDIEFGDKSLVWGFDVEESGPRVRFTMRINEKGNWHEIGEVSRDAGKTWFKFLEMELTKVPETATK